MSLRPNYRRNPRHGVLRFAVLIWFAVSQIGGCGDPGPTTQPAEKPEPKISQKVAKPVEREDDFVEPGSMPGRTHVVRPKETLYGLAQHYYGSKNQWRRIYYANRNRLTDPNELPVGIRLIIP